MTRALLLPLLLCAACASHLPPVPNPGYSTPEAVLTAVEQDFWRHGKDGTCALDTVRSDGWVLVICGRRDGTIRWYDTWLMVKGIRQHD
jgi:hypothetical protein